VAIEKNENLSPGLAKLAKGLHPSTHRRAPPPPARRWPGRCCPLPGCSLARPSAAPLKAGDTPRRFCLSWEDCNPAPGWQACHRSGDNELEAKGGGKKQ